jgi:hypothetical protein
MWSFDNSFKKMRQECAGALYRFVGTFRVRAVRWKSVYEVVCYARMDKLAAFGVVALDDIAKARVVRGHVVTRTS